MERSIINTMDCKAIMDELDHLGDLPYGDKITKKINEIVEAINYLLKEDRERIR